jgi:16S rRNA processing protein RimM
VPKKQASGPSAQTQLRVGRLTKAHGLKGGLKLELFTDDPDKRFQPGSEFSLQVPTSSPWHGKRLALAELRWYNGQPVGFFEGVSDREGAESLVKAILWIDHSPDEAPEEDAWYDHQLVGLAVVRDGAPVGTIARVEHFPAQDLLVVNVGDREVLVPFVKAIVPSVDIEKRVVTVTPPAGLFEDLPDEDDSKPEGRGASASRADAHAEASVAAASTETVERAANAESDAGAAARTADVDLGPIAAADPETGTAAGDAAGEAADAAETAVPEAEADAAASVTAASDA